MIKKIMYGLSLAMAIVLAACSQPAKPTKRSSEPSSSAAQTVSSTSAEKEQVQSIDGSYRGQDAESTILLVVTGQKEPIQSQTRMEKKRPKRWRSIRSINPCVSEMNSTVTE